MSICLHVHLVSPRILDETSSIITIPVHTIPSQTCPDRTRIQPSTLAIHPTTCSSETNAPHPRGISLTHPPLLLLKSIILLLTHQPLQLTLILNLDLREPTLPLGPLIYDARFLAQHVVRLRDRARDGTEDVGGGFDGFYGADGVAFGDFGAGGGEFDVDYVAEGFGGVGCYADCACEWGWVVSG